MPTDLTISFSDVERETLERVRMQQGLDTIEQAAEWLAKRGIRRGAQRITGRGRALHLAGRGRA